MPAVINSFNEPLHRYQHSPLHTFQTSYSPSCSRTCLVQGSSQSRCTYSAIISTPKMHKHTKAELSAAQHCTQCPHRSSRTRYPHSLSRAQQPTQLVTHSQVFLSDCHDTAVPSLSLGTLQGPTSFLICKKHNTRAIRPVASDNTIAYRP